MKSLLTLALYILPILVSNSAFSQTKNSLYTWGYNVTGQLGVGDKKDKITPQYVSDGWKFMAGGYDFTFGINQNGELYACGSNGKGQRGDSDYLDHPTFKRVGTESNWKFVSAGWTHVLGINTNGELYSWGSNFDGELGIGTDTIYYSIKPKRIGNESVWISAAAGSSHSLAINSKGELYAWGDNIDGQLGLGHNTSQISPQRVGTDSNWVKVVAGKEYSIAINSKGYLFTFGNNRYGQLGNGNTTRQYTLQRVGSDSNFIDAAAGWYHTLALKSTGELYSWGNNKSGQLGIGNNTDQNTPQRVGNQSNYISVATGSYNSLALTNDGTLYSFGDNSIGQLGLGLTSNPTVPNKIGTNSNWGFIGCGTAHCLAIEKLNGKVNVTNLEAGKKSIYIAYPNPSKTSVFIQSNKPIIGEKFEVYGLTGNKVITGFFTENQSVNISQLISGIYLMKIGNQTVRFEKE